MCNFSSSSSYLVNLASALSPGILRIGGTAADRLIFEESASVPAVESLFPLDGGDCSYELKPYNLDSCGFSELGFTTLNNFTMTGMLGYHQVEI